MSGKARLGVGGTRKAPAIRREDLDDNVATYRPEADGRAVEERLQYVRLDRVEPSPFQVRRVFPESEIEGLADSIRDTGLVHPPKGRPHAEKPGWVELMPGEMRLRALQRLIERGEADALLRRGTGGEWLVPIVVVSVADERAEAMVFAENESRTDLSAWEWALAWQQRRDRRMERGQPATVRDVAAAHRKAHTTIGEYLRVADAISPEVLAEAGVVAEGGADHGRMARLPFVALKGVARSAARGTMPAAEHLLQELRSVGDRAAKERLRPRERGAGKGSFQINIRQPLPELTPGQAARYLNRISTVLPILAHKAAEGIESEDAQELAATLEEVASVLREGG